MVNDRQVISIVHAWSVLLSVDADNQASGRAYGGAGVGEAELSANRAFGMYEMDVEVI